MTAGTNCRIQCVPRDVVGVLVLGRAEAAHHQAESLGTQGTVYERRDGTWTSCPSLRRTFIGNIRKCREWVRYSWNIAGADTSCKHFWGAWKEEYCSSVCVWFNGWGGCLVLSVWGWGVLQEERNHCSRLRLPKTCLHLPSSAVSP